MLEIKKDIYWLGIVDYASKEFHGYSLSPQGTTYNSYLLKDKKNVLFDTVKTGHASEYIRILKQHIEPEKIDYIVVNHLELDHAGVLPEIIALCKPEKVFCSVTGKQTMEAIFDTTGWPIVAVKTGDSISTGEHTISFLEAKMLHWPDSMFSYIPEKKLLISNDAFGENIASSERFTDEIPRHVLDHAMNEYYHNIILPYSARVQAVLKQVAEMNLDIDMIAPDHGLIIRGKDEIAHVLELYSAYAEQKTKARAVVLYDTMWDSTAAMANAIVEGIAAAGISVRAMHLKQHHHSEVMSEVAHCGLVVVGSPTHNNGVLPDVAAMMRYMIGLKPKNRLGAAFGSYGWSGEASKQLHEQLAAAGFDMPVEPLKTLYVPKEAVLQQCVEMGKTLGEALKAKVG
ncbi:MAG: flavodoxin domain-containing protein [Deferribacteraceae bacterium]|jgi:flavorubredoxin|nr:flavodoxin domain-containing protein [Deferribacteraceae bacterium]